MTSPGPVTEVVQASGPNVPAVLARVETRLAAVSAGHGAELAAHGGATIAAGGKRLRPLLVALAAGDESSADVVRAGVAVELVHSATLVHDDVLDAASLRRGVPTVVAAGGREMAVATGDLLFARAFSELAGSRSAAAIRILSDASSALARGELLQRADAWRADTPVERYLLRCELKTARLFEAACRLGALAAGGDDDRQDRLAAFARRIGLAFQVLDDVLDVSGPAERTGKHRGTDLLDGTVTLPLLLARARAPELGSLDPRSITTPQQAAEVCDRIEASGALDAAREQALGMVAEAKEELPADLPARQRAALELVADNVVARYA
jgi:geranylgeranyl pyrophosphate synthase